MLCWGLTGCDEAGPASAAMGDASVVDDLGPATFDPRSPPSCDPSRHVDCFFNVECRDGMVRMTSGRPYPCCNDAQCQAALNANVCWGTRLACPEGCGPERRWRCNPGRLLEGYGSGQTPSDLCAGGGKAPGDPCARDENCAPQRAGLPGRLRCDRDAGACVPAPRPSVDAGTGCLADDDCAEGMICSCEAGGAGRCQPGT